MKLPLAAVFPRASRVGGVERVVWEVLKHFGGTRDTFFVGQQAEDLPPPVRHLALPPAGRSATLRPLVFRHRARVALAGLGPATTLSFGVQAPPGDVLWVGSVHRAWLEAALAVPLGPVDLPASTRFLMPRHRALLALERSYFRSQRPRYVFCTSQREVDDLHRLYDVPHERMRVVPNGFDPDTFDPATTRRRRDHERHRMDVQDEDVVLLFLANELHRKGFGVLLQAVARVRDPRLRVDVVGRSPLTAYDSRIRALGLQDRVRYHGPSDDVAGCLAAADVLVLPSQYEPFGLVVIEALAAGVPVVTTAVTGAAAAMTHGVEGLVQQDPHDVEELASLLETCLSQDQRRAWADLAPAAAQPYRWSAVLGAVEPLLD